MIRIKYSLGKTINLGNFQSARVDIGAEVDTEQEHLQEDLTNMKSFVRDELKIAIHNKDWE
jgi:hypothetical protein